MLTGRAPLQLTARRLRTGELDIQDYLAAAQDRVETLEPQIEALLPEANRWTRLRREAERLASRFPDPEERPPLFGVLVGVKDIFNVAGFETRAGSRLPAALFTGPEAPVVTRLKEMGALILGKTVTTEFACFVPGPTRNPVNPAHTPGGSSSGSAAAVAAGYCPLALGSQTIGSVVRPAAFCGIAGFKPSRGRLSTEGVVPVADSLDHVGFFVQDATELPAALGWLSLAGAAGDPDTAVLGVADGAYLAQATPGALAGFERQIARLMGAGRRIQRASLLDDIEAINRRHKRLMMAEMAEAHRGWFAAHADLYASETAALIREGQTVSAAEAAAARAGRDTLRGELEAALDDAGVQAWIAPAATGPAPHGLETTGDPIMNLPWTHAGLPVAALPAGRAENGMPLGLQIVGRFGEDAFVAALAGHIARELGDGGA